jgi:hypothetical protein
MYSPTTPDLRVTRKSNLAGEERKSEKGDEALGAPSAGGELGCWRDTGAAGRIGRRWVAQRLSDGLGFIDSSLLLMHRFPFEGSQARQEERDRERKSHLGVATSSGKQGDRCSAVGDNHGALTSSKTNWYGVHHPRSTPFVHPFSYPAPFSSSLLFLSLTCPHMPFFWESSKCGCYVKNPEQYGTHAAHGVFQELDVNLGNRMHIYLCMFLW